MRNLIDIFIKEGIHKLHDDINSKLDDKLEEAAILYGVDIINKDEVMRRCVVHHFDDREVKELHIDGSLVMVFTLPKIPINLGMDEPFSVSASFQCSEILRPVHQLD